MTWATILPFYLFLKLGPQDRSIRVTVNINADD